MKNIFVGNLSYSTTQDDLRSLFENYGAVERVSVMTDRETGQPRGFAFVEMTGADEADAAINSLNGQDLHGRTLNVNEARPRGEGAPRGGGGFGGNKSGGGGGGRPSGGGGGFARQRREPRW